MSNLQEAFREAARREFAMVPDERELDYSFSPGFQRKMRRIIRAQVHGYWNMVNTLGKRIAIAAAIIVMLLTTTMAIKPIRERVIKFFVDVYEEYFEITFGEEKRGDLYPMPEPMTRYTFSWVPEGYNEAYCSKLDALITTVWTSNVGEDILLSQGAGVQETTLDHIEERITKYKHEDLLILYLPMNGRDTYLWEQYGYVFQIYVSDNVSFETALQMIDSLKAKGK